MTSKEIAKKLDMITQALEKQIPRKVIDSFMKGGWICPNCHNYVDVIKADEYCSKCGQRLDWSDSE